MHLVGHLHISLKRLQISTRLTSQKTAVLLCFYSTGEHKIIRLSTMFLASGAVLWLFVAWNGCRVFKCFMSQCHCILYSCTSFTLHSIADASWRSHVVHTQECKFLFLVTSFSERTWAGELLSEYLWFRNFKTCHFSILN